MNDAILNRVFTFFQESRDFNGILLLNLLAGVSASPDQARDAVAQLVQDGKVTLTFASHAGNPHIKRLPDLPVEQQLARLEVDDPDSLCIYPTASVVRELSNLSTYDTRPFSRRLALCEPQLTPVFFELIVLDRYYRDPRYQFKFNDYCGSIGLTAEHFDSADVAERDKIFLQTFGIGYTPSRERVVVVYLRYLAHLSPEHQQVWNAHIVQTSCLMNSDYAQATICGEWPVYHSAYQAFLTEQAEINRLAEMIGKPPLFKVVFLDDRPEGFGPMIRPTKRNFDEFVHLLDKMISENINRDFFVGDIHLERTIPRKDGTVEVERPGTLQLLHTWLSSKYRDSTGADVAVDVLGPLRAVRKVRQKPAHALSADAYDQSLTGRQDDIVGEACTALTRLRLILSSHPKAKGRYSAPKWLDSDKIVFY
jgi:hypothetical protein